jgi:predicted RND superfamily exporter protein
LDRAILPLVPALLAAGTCALLVAVTGARLSPLSAALEPLVLAVGVEFGLLLEARYREARRGGGTASEAARAATETVGAPVAVAAATVALGFAVLVVSRLGVLEQFGLLAAVELMLCALAAILIVPGLAAALDRRREAGSADERALAPGFPMTRTPVG